MVPTRAERGPKRQLEAANVNFGDELVWGRVHAVRVILLLVFFCSCSNLDILIVGHNSTISGDLLVLANAKFLEKGASYAARSKSPCVISWLGFKQ